MSSVETNDFPKSILLCPKVSIFRTSVADEPAARGKAIPSQEKEDRIWISNPENPGQLSGISAARVQPCGAVLAALPLVEHRHCAAKDGASSPTARDNSSSTVEVRVNCNMRTGAAGVWLVQTTILVTREL
jgi:hypothetical protein